MGLCHMLTLAQGEDVSCAWLALPELFPHVTGLEASMGPLEGHK